VVAVEAECLLAALFQHLARQILAVAVEALVVAVAAPLQVPVAQVL
jgi:hypothetical protein